MKKITYKVLLLGFVTALFSCKSGEQTSGDRSQQGGPQRQQGQGGPGGGNRQGGRPSTDEIFSMMDADKNNLIEINEAQGPLKQDFSKIDSDGDGFITKEELENAPKPDRQGPPNGGGRR